jgi:hypothetical protein
MDKRYQVFISSTYTDLKDERLAVTKTLMLMDCIPAGMEMFGAFDEDQWDFIKRVIDDCDYYLLIIAGRYGSITKEEISYTEMEYKYAVDIGIPVIAMLHNNPDDISVGKSDVSSELKAKLDDFRKHVSTGRLVDFWKTPDDLAGKVAISLSRTIKLKPAIGWVRANTVANEDILNDINRLRNEKDLLIQQINDLKVSTRPITIDQSTIASLDEEYSISGEIFNMNRPNTPWIASHSWRTLFSIIAPYILEKKPSSNIKDELLTELLRKNNLPNSHHNTLHDQDFKTLLIQFNALRLIELNPVRDIVNNTDMGVSLTPQGQQLLFETRVIRTTQT